MIHVWTKPEPVRAGRRPIVLVVDEDPIVRGTALRLLRYVDVAGVALPNARAATSWLRGSATASIVFADRKYVEVIAEALDSLPAPHGRPIVIALSTDGDLAQHAAALADGADGLSLKPLEPSAFLNAVSSLLQLAPRRKRVLLVDDDQDIRDSFGLLLEDHGYDVVPAPHGRAAWDALEKGLAPDVILLDMMMPVMNGREIWDKLQTSRHKKTPIVVITAGRDASLTAPILRKPIAMNELLAAVERASA